MSILFVQKTNFIPNMAGEGANQTWPIPKIGILFFFIYIYYYTEWQEIIKL